MSINYLGKATPVFPPGRTPKRIPVGLAGWNIPLRVKVANHQVTLDDYQAVLDYTLHTVMNLLKAIDDTRSVAETSRYVNRLVKVLCCGRVLQFDSNNVGQRCSYCDQSCLCICCKSRHRRKLGQAIRADIPYGTLDRAISLTLTTIPPHTEEAELKNLQFLNWARTLLVKKLGRMRREDAHWDSVKIWVLGIHAKPTSLNQYFAGHIHLLIRTGPHSNAERMRQDLEDYWHKVTFKNLGQPAHVACDAFGSKITRAKRPRKDTISLQHLENKIAYITNPHERDDSPELTARRYQLFESAGIKCSYSRSRGDEEPFRMPTKPSYDAAKLGKKFIVAFSITSNDWMRRSVDQQGEQLAKLGDQAKAYILQLLPNKLRKKIELKWSNDKNNDVTT